MELSDINAYHEAGHAFIAIYVGASVVSVSLEPEWDDGPARHADIQVKWPLNQFDSRELSKNMIRVALAGPVAEMLYRGEPYHPGFVAEWASDWKQAWKASCELFSDERRRLKYLEQITVQLYRLIDQQQNWSALAAISDELLAHERLDGEEVEGIVRQWLS